MQAVFCFFGLTVGFTSEDFMVRRFVCFFGEVLICRGELLVSDRVGVLVEVGLRVEEKCFVLEEVLVFFQLKQNMMISKSSLEHLFTLDRSI